MTHSLSLFVGLLKYRAGRRAVERVLKAKQCRACHCTCSAAATRMARSGAMLFLSMPNRRKKKKKTRWRPAEQALLDRSRPAEPCENTDSVCTRKHCTPGGRSQGKGKTVWIQNDSLYIIICFSLLHAQHPGLLCSVIFIRSPNFSRP